MCGPGTAAAGGEPGPASDDDLAASLARGLLQRRPVPDLAFTFLTLATAAADAQECGEEQRWLDVWQDSDTISALKAGTAGSGGAYRRVARRAVHYRWDGRQLQRRMHDGSVRVRPPPEERLSLVKAVHERTGHLGVRRTLALLQAGHWWYGMRAVVQQVVRQCQACDLSHAAGAALPSQLHPLPIKGLFYRMSVDLAGPLIRSEPDGNRYCMVVIEHFSKHVELIPLRDKTSARTARAFANVLARFAAPAEALTDGGAEFEGEFAQLLELAFIDHRTTSPNHPQADGAAERIVRVLKDTLRKACYEAADPAAWEQSVPELLLGYRCSPQRSTRYSPYELLYGGARSVVPPAVRERLSEPLDFDDPAVAADSLLQRAAWVRQAYPAAAGNLLIAQHRDTLRYSAIRTGRYLAKPITYAPGDYVYVRRMDVANTLQFPQHDTILHVLSVGPLGVALLVGSDGARTRRRVEHLHPCHLDMDPAIDLQRFRPRRDLQCELCGSPHQGARMVLCDGCNTSWHTHCLRLPRVPHGTWLCPRCKELDAGQPVLPRPTAAAAPPPPLAASSPASTMASPPPAAQPTGSPSPGSAAPTPAEQAAQRRSPRLVRVPFAPVVARSEELGQLLFPRAETRRRDEEAAGLNGRQVQRKVPGSGDGVELGVLEYQGALARPRYFLVRYSLLRS